jgi:release factor glutamine methyltransferase
VAPFRLSKALAYGKSRLIDSSGTPGLDAEVLLMFVLRRERAYLRTWPERRLDDDQAEAFCTLIDRRAGGEPIAYLTGQREFWSRTFHVGPDVLIPRPDTELLVDLALTAIPPDRETDILELGTGSGIIAITLAAERPQARILATDLSLPALVTARANASRLGCSNLSFAHGNWFAAVGGQYRFDLIVSNPPYIAEQDPHLKQGDLRFEPAMALSSGPEGLDALRQIGEGARAHLKPGAHLILEHGYDQAQPLGGILDHLGYSDIAHHHDLQGHLRATVARYDHPPSFDTDASP